MLTQDELFLLRQALHNVQFGLRFRRPETEDVKDAVGLLRRTKLGVADRLENECRRVMRGQKPSPQTIDFVRSLHGTVAKLAGQTGRGASTTAPTAETPGAVETPADSKGKPKPRGKPTGPPRAENGAPALLLFGALSAYHGYERIGTDKATVSENIGHPIRGEALRELTRETLPDGTKGRAVAAGAVSNFWRWGFGKPGCKGDGKYSYNRRCKDKQALADALLQIDKALESGTFGKPEGTPIRPRGRNVGAAALGQDLALPGARRKTEGSLKHTAARYSHDDHDSPDFETGYNFHELEEAEALEDFG